MHTIPQKSQYHLCSLLSQSHIGIFKVIATKLPTGPLKAPVRAAAARAASEPARAAGEAARAAVESARAAVEPPARLVSLRVCHHRSEGALVSAPGQSGGEFPAELMPSSWERCVVDRPYFFLNLHHLLFSDRICQF